MHEPLPRRSAVAAPDAQHILHRDYETRSRAILKTVGTHRYAADPGTEILCAAFAVDSDPVQLWIPGDPVPPEFIEAAHNPHWMLAAHGDHFETIVEQYVLAPRYGWPLVPLERHACTMALALAHGLPARLSAVADALELSNRKDAAGERLMHQRRSPGVRVRMRILPAHTGLMIHSALIGFMHIADKTLRRNVSCMIGCQHCRQPSNRYGC